MGSYHFLFMGEEWEGGMEAQRSLVTPQLDRGEPGLRPLGGDPRSHWGAWALRPSQWLPWALGGIDRLWGRQS